MLMGLLCPSILVVRFDRDGFLVGSEQRPVPIFHDMQPPYDIYNEQVEFVSKAWQAEIGLRLAPIEVKKFWSTEHEIGIEDYPVHFHEVLSDPNADEERKTYIRSAIEQWDNAGQFVLQWGNDYWLDRNGCVVST